MRFLLIVTKTGDISGPRDPDHLARVRSAIEAEIASGNLLATGALGKRATTAARVTSQQGKITVEDPPGGDGWLAAGGYSLLDVASKAEAIAKARARLEIMGDGVVELIQVSEMHPPPRAVI